MMTVIRDHRVPVLPEPQLSRRLRIGMVAPAWFAIPPAGYGGIERVVSVLTEGLVAAGHDVTLFAAVGSRTGARLVTPLPAPPPLGDLASMTDDLIHCTTAFLRADEFDVIHDHTGMGPALGALVNRRTPVVHTLHGPWTEPGRRMLALVDHRIHVVAISQAQRAANPELHCAGIVYNGIDVDAHPFQRAKEDFLVFVGRVSAEKRPEVAIEVARRAKLPLVMIIKRSEPAERAYFDEVIAPHLGDDVVVLDQPPHEVKVDLMGRARALVFPIDWPEPFGLVMTEAMACGTPVITCPLGAAPEIVADGVTGFLCSTKGEMVDAVTAAAELRPEDCRFRVEKLFSAQAMVAGYESVYRSALTSSRRTGHQGSRQRIAELA
jgi:glycosyltransferase involved in cell wall biosynthesis